MALICIFLMISDADHICMYLLAIYISLERFLFTSFAHFQSQIIVIILLLNYMSFFTYFGYKSLIRYMICKYFLPFAGCLFILLIVSVALYKLFNLLQSYLFAFAFIAYDFGVISQKSLLRPIGTFTGYFQEFVLCLIFQSLVHFKLIF